MSYCLDLLYRKRLATKEVRIGNMTMGANNPIRLQSMTTTDTMDTAASVAQSIRMIEAGCELVRLTAPSKNEAVNLSVIKNSLNEKGYNTPLVADIHFTPNAAEIASGLVEKVRVNPGNYADKKKFEEIEYTDESYEAELLRIEEKFTPLVLLCKKHGTAMRIGTNHGSLSDRILSRYGDTPAGMVESAMEFIRICEKLDYDQLVVSMKASNTIVMVQAYRLLVAEMLKRGVIYPLHLGVTEAGEGEDGRIKSAVGIGALLEDGIGDTIRVSLTEEPEFEIPVARKLAEKCQNKDNIKSTQEEVTDLPYNPFDYQRSPSFSVHNIGNQQVPVVVGDLSLRHEITPASLFGLGYVYSVPLDKWNVLDLAADYVYIGRNIINFELPGTLGVITSFELWQAKHQNKPGFYPLLTNENLSFLDKNQKGFLLVNAEEEVSIEWSQYTQLVLVVQTKFANKTQLFRQFRLNYAKKQLKNPVVMRTTSHEKEAETFQLTVAADMGATFIDGFGDGIWISAEQPPQLINSTSFGILQATRSRISKTEYISCPSCGRTLFDLQETTAKIREKTAHLKGIKIGIMGCIVNGPGEMADADYGYVGTGPGKINLYKEKTVVKRNIPEDDAVQALIDLIKEHDDWVETTS
ncbi:MAG: (E)-4-hydroxy-3-methylbut-2-enyl-diphosphate synthase [Bacteroidetes bacterium]|nr:(E)-4-hydroxy-3-methylbut-2-enyl-diphosphate synthase [Bacteroidota bacterium]